MPSDLQLMTSADLTAVEVRLLHHFRQLKPEAQRVASVIMYQYTTNAGLRKAPTFQVVKGGQS